MLVTSGFSPILLIKNKTKQSFTGFITLICKLMYLVPQLQSSFNVWNLAENSLMLNDFKFKETPQRNFWFP